MKEVFLFKLTLFIFKCTIIFTCLFIIFFWIKYEELKLVLITDRIFLFNKNEMRVSKRLWKPKIYTNIDLYLSYKSSLFTVKGRIIKSYESKRLN
jgi:hypothetical protein